jgi:hypothetical protein
MHVTSQDGFMDYREVQEYFGQQGYKVEELDQLIEVIWYAYINLHYCFSVRG